MNDQINRKVTSPLLRLQVILASSMFLALLIPPYPIAVISGTDLVQRQGLKAILLIDILNIAPQVPYNLPPFVQLIKALPLIIGIISIILLVHSMTKRNNTISAKPLLFISAAGIVATIFHNTIYDAMARMGWSTNFWARFIHEWPYLIRYMQRPERILLTSWFFLLIWGALLLTSSMRIRNENHKS